MARVILKNEELTLLINHRFREGNELDGDCRDVSISGVQLYAGPDETGCNWDISVYSGPASCSGIVRKIIEDFRSNYNLKEP